MHAQITKHMLEKLAKMVPTWSQNLSKIDPGGPLDASKEGASKTSFDDVGSILEPPLGPLWDHFGHHFWMFFRSAFLKALASIWAPKTPPK